MNEHFKKNKLLGSLQFAFRAKQNIQQRMLYNTLRKILKSIKITIEAQQQLF